MPTARDLIHLWAQRLAVEQQRVAGQEADQPVASVSARLLQTIGALFLYEFMLPAGTSMEIDTPVSIVPADDLEPTEGVVLSCRGNVALVQVFDHIGQSLPSLTIIPDRAGQLATWENRFREMLAQPDVYRLGPADRLAAILDTAGLDEASGTGAAIISTIWLTDPMLLRQKIAAQAMELIRANKRILLLCPDHHEADDSAGAIAKAMKAGGLTYKTWISRYELTLASHACGLSIHDLAFEAQMHQFYAKSRADKAALRKKYERFRELTPILAYKSQKQKDLDEVRLLEWRLLTQLTDLQAKVKEANTTLAEYEHLPLLRRLSMQTVGKNTESLRQYLELYEAQIAGLMKEIDIAKARIAELAPEAAVPKDMRPEFEELKEDIVRLGGTKKIRELLAAEENTNRQAFIQNRRLVITTPGRLLSDPLFTRIRFDVLIAENAPRISAAALLGAAALVKERIVLTGDQHEIRSAGLWRSPEVSAGR
ncbi:MAG TPA: hypothetical protein VFS39_02645 [Nitrospira sp.]|nr:hypothetical protein [Nitrospira sp.]